MAVDLVPTERLRRWSRASLLWRPVAEVAAEFPELDGMRIRVDLLPWGSRRLGTASILERPPRVAFHPGLVNRPEQLAATAAHEFTHLLQWPLRALPNGERACDLYALARFGTRFVAPPYYLKVPARARARWHPWAAVATELARSALSERRRGRRHYIRWWEEQFRAQSSRAVPLSRFGAGPESDPAGGRAPVG